MPKISEYPNDAAPEAADIIPFVDVSAGATEKVTLANLAASAPFAAQYAPLDGVMGYAFFGDNVALARPTGYAAITWVGYDGYTPNNVASGDVVLWRTAPAPTIIQTKAVQASGTSQSVTFDSTPVAGNLLVAFATIQAQTASNLGLPAGWSEATRGTAGGTGIGMLVAYRESTGDETGVSFATSGSANVITIQVVEVQDCTTLDVAFTEGFSSATSANLGPSPAIDTARELIFAALAWNATVGSISGDVDYTATVSSLARARLWRRFATAVETPEFDATWTTSATCIGALISFRGL